MTRTPLSLSKGQRSRSPGKPLWLAVNYMDDKIFYATAQSEALPDDLGAGA